MAASLDQIIASLGSVYQPQIDSVNAQKALIPEQLHNDETSLEGTKNNAFDSILSGARRRGTGVAFGGIPLGEQASYTANSYLPAMANLRSTYAAKGNSLQDAINSINENRFNQANGIYQFGVQQEMEQQRLAEQKRQFDEQQAAAAREAAASRAAASSGGFSPTFGGGGGVAPAGGAAPKAGPQLYSNGKSLQDAYNSVQQLMQSRNTPVIASTYKAIQAAAQKGSQYDQAKFQLLNQLYGNSLAKNGIGVVTGKF